MIYNIRKIFTILSLMVVGSTIVYNCEPDPDSLGEQLFLDDAATGNETSLDLIAYNISNNDTVRTDAFYLKDLIDNGVTRSKAVLGAFNEGQFGLQKASYFTQVRLNAYNPDFGTNAEVDSVVLVIKPTYRADSIKTTTDEDYVYPDGNVAAKKVVNTYPAVKFGKAKKNLTLKVEEVTEFMNGNTDPVYSNYNFATSTVLGIKQFSGDVNSVVITKDDTDNTELFKTSAVGFRMKLDETFFQQKILDKKGQPVLSDVSNFIRHFRGMKISVLEDDGYLFQFDPNELEMIMYYKNDKEVDGVNTRPQNKFVFDLKSANVHTGYYEYNRAGAEINTYALGNTTTGDLKLYAQGMGGNSIGVKFPKATIDDLKKMYQNDKAAIISAKIRIYTDENTWTNPYTKPDYNDFSIVQKDKDASGKITTAFTADYTSLPTFMPIRAYNLDKNPSYYEFTVTQSLKNIVESGEDYTNKYFKIDLAQFLKNSSDAIAGYSYTSRSFAPLRAVFVGSDPANANRIQVRVTHGTK